MDNIKNIVHDVIGKISLQQNNPQNQLENSWKNIISEKEQKHIRLDGYKNGVLMTLVDSPAWLYEFKRKKNKILTALQKEDVWQQKYLFWEKAGRENQRQ